MDPPVVDMIHLQNSFPSLQKKRMIEYWHQCIDTDTRKINKHILFWCLFKQDGLSILFMFFVFPEGAELNIEK